MIGIELANFSKTLPMGLRQAASLLDEKLKGSLAALLGSLLLREHDILVAFTEYNRNVIRLEPPLICQREHSDALIQALESILCAASSGSFRVTSGTENPQRLHDGPQGQSLLGTGQRSVSGPSMASGTLTQDDEVRHRTPIRRELRLEFIVKFPRIASFSIAAIYGFRCDG